VTTGRTAATPRSRSCGGCWTKPGSNRPPGAVPGMETGTGRPWAAPSCLPGAGHAGARAPARQGRRLCRRLAQQRAVPARARGEALAVACLQGLELLQQDVGAGGADVLDRAAAERRE